MAQAQVEAALQDKAAVEAVMASLQVQLFDYHKDSQTKGCE